MSKSSGKGEGKGPDKGKKKKDRVAELGEAAHQIWLAGLGAVAAAEEEGGKLFRSLVARGAHFEERVAEPLGRARGRVREAVDETRQRASDAASSVERHFDEGVGDAMRRLGLPARDELRKLSRRIEELAERLEELAGSGGTTARKSSAKQKATARKRS